MATAKVTDQTEYTGSLAATDFFYLVRSAEAAGARDFKFAGSRLQGSHANLTAFSGLTLAADKLPYGNGLGTLGLADFTAFGRSLVDDADAAAGRATLGLGAGVTAEFQTLIGLPASVDMASTPASGTCAVQFTFKDSAGAALSHAVAGLAYFSNSTGLAIAAATSAAVLTNGALVELVAGNVDFFVTSAAGLLGVTVTAPAGTYYMSFVLPNGKIITSGAIVVNA